MYFNHMKDTLATVLITSMHNFIYSSTITKQLLQVHAEMKARVK